MKIHLASEHENFTQIRLRKTSMRFSLPNPDRWLIRYIVATVLCVLFCCLSSKKVIFYQISVFQKRVIDCVRKLGWRALQQRSGKESITISLAVNTGSLEKVIDEFRNMARILERKAQKGVRSACYSNSVSFWYWQAMQHLKISMDFFARPYLWIALKSCTGYVPDTLNTDAITAQSRNYSQGVYL